MVASIIPEAYFSLSKSKVLEQYEKLKKLDVIVSYSVKTNANVTPILEENTDSEFNVHSFEDLAKVKNLQKVWFFLQGSQEQKIRDAIAQGVTKFIVDNIVDLEKLTKILDTTDTKIDLLLRLKLKEHSIDTGRFFVFGMSSKTINEKIAQLKPHSKIDKIGVHMYRKTQNIAEWNLQFELQELLTEQTLQSIDILNIGGGLPAQYKNTSDKNIPQILEKVEQLVDWANSYNTQITMEPGRFIAAPAIKLHTFVLSTYENNVIINASVYNTFLDSILVVPVRLLVQGELVQGDSFVIKGCTPDSLDIFRYDVVLPQKPKEGDEIIFLNAGAYNFATNFFSLPSVVTKIVE